MCLAMHWTHKECTNFPTSQPPSTACTQPGSHQLTKSPGSDRAKCPGVSDSPPPPPETSWPDVHGTGPPREQAVSSSGQCLWVLIPPPPPPGQAHRALTQWWPNSPPGSVPSQWRQQLPAGPHQLCDLGRATFQKLSPLEGVIC